MTQLSPHLTLEELACVNRLGWPWGGYAAGEVIAPYPDVFVEHRALVLADLFEDLRRTLGNAPIRIVSGYRTPNYNREIGGARLSQHVEGRALDIKHQTLSAAEVHRTIMAGLEEGHFPQLGGLGRYLTFTHIDVRPRKNGRVMMWADSDLKET